MKILTGVRLINWHYFRDQTISFNGSTLITGDSGSGKSTILDAIQYVLVGDLRHVRFNSAAHDSSGRTLRTYLRGKTGQSEESNEASYLRVGDFTSYIILEFSDTRTAAPFLLGVAVDSYASGDQSDPCFFKAEATALSGFAVLENRVVYNISRLRERARAQSNLTLYPTVDRYQKDLLHKLGYLSKHFFTVLTKAMGFRPISNMRTFVYSYLLDNDPVKLDVMRETMAQYNRFQILVDDTKKKIADLDRIDSRHREVEMLLRRIGIQEYVIQRARVEEAREQVASWAAEVKRLQTEAARADSARKSLEASRSQAEAEKQELSRQIYTNPTQQTLERLNLEIQAAESDLRRQRAALEQAVTACTQEARSLDRVIHGFGALPIAQEDGEAVSEALGILRAASPAFSNHNSALRQPEFLDKVATSVRSLWSAAEHVSRSCSAEIASLQQQGKQAMERLKALGHNKLTYEQAVERLISLIKAQVQVDGKPVSPIVLCELLEVLDPRWQNAVEGYLNTQRFDLIVPEAAFDQSLAVYERSKREEGIHGVGLVDGQKQLRERPRPEPNALSYEVKTSDPVARAYVDKLLGSVIKCSNEQELKRYRTSITPTCMTYRNGVARRINPAVYQTPYIGRRAILRQIEQVRQEITEVDAKIRSTEEHRKAAADLISELGDREHRYAVLTQNLVLADAIPQTEALRKRLLKERSEVDLTEVTRLQARVADVESRIKTLDEGIRREISAHASAGSHAGLAQERGREETQKLSLAVDTLARISQSRPELVEEADARYEEAARSRKPGAIAETFETNMAGQRSRVTDMRKELVSLRAAYNRDHQFGGDELADDNAAYSAELAKLRASELPKYEEQIAKAREAAEQEFKDHFVSKLKERIDRAREQFTLLNRKLRDIEFGQERYQFEVRPHPDLREYYDMITDDVLLDGGQSLFSDLFQSRHGNAVKDFFDRLLTPDPSAREKELERLVDYRSYLEFDIKVHAGAEVTRFSNVATQRSGGESQTPYYVAIAASFLQLYRGSNSDDSVQLMLFDEAFDKMDGDRIQKTLMFVRELGLQLVAAAPPERIEWISPHVSTTILVVREGQWVTVTDYQQELAHLDDVAITGEGRQA